MTPILYLLQVCVILYVYSMSGYISNIARCAGQGGFLGRVYKCLRGRVNVRLSLFSMS